ncbi:MAG: YceI family protein [Luteolibacter sp.]|uniref:YceI family protein n=1 Tax=Luteolibacter sp. TaxID=1962973 RepID=UPI003266B886
MDQRHTPIAAADLKNLLAGPRPPSLIDVRLEEDFHGSHLPGAQNNCVFEVAFTERMPQIAPDFLSPVCVYGADANSLESRMAAEKLCRLGYAEVYDFKNGIDGWIAAGFPVEGGSVPTTPPTAADGQFPIDLAESRIRWVGRNLLNRHEGFIALKAGWLRMEAGRLTGGGFVIDMCSIHCIDLEGNALHDVLIRHLMDHDFFDSAKFPEATFAITDAIEVPDATPGSPDLTIMGVLSLKGVSHPLEFTACTGVTAEGKPAAQATLAFDRTLWNVIYGSGKWFRHPGGHLVNDLIELQLRIVGT